MTKPQSKKPVSARPGAPSADEKEALPLVARIVNHLLTPGSSLTSSVWTAFNIIMIWLFLCWLLFLFSFPTSIHVWAFGILGLGLLVSTNWFMSEIFKAGLDFDSQQAAKQQQQEQQQLETVAEKKDVSAKEEKVEVKKNAAIESKKSKKQEAEPVAAAAAPNKSQPNAPQQKKGQSQPSQQQGKKQK